MATARSHRVTLPSWLVAVAVVAGAGASPARAATRCELPAAIGFAAEEEPVPGGATRVVVRSAATEDGAILPGDVVLQVNGTRVARCADVENAAASARAAGLVLLVAVERQGRLLALAASSQPERRAPAVAALATGTRAAAPGPGARETGTPAESAAGAEAPAARPATEVAAPPAPPPAPPRPAIAARPSALASLPAASAASAVERDAAARAARILGSIEPVARTGVPLPIYDSRVRAAEAELARDVGGAVATSSGLRAAVDSILECYRVAGEIRRMKQQHVEDEGSEPAVRAVNLPYLSTSRVPRWVAEYPFLEESVSSQPGESFLGVGEQAGTWNPDRAAELLWQRASDETDDLAEWGDKARVG